jgi:hypothetical protein
MEELQRNNTGIYDSGVGAIKIRTEISPVFRLFRDVSDDWPSMTEGKSSIVQYVFTHCPLSNGRSSPQVTHSVTENESQHIDGGHRVFVDFSLRHRDLFHWNAC